MKDARRRRTQGCLTDCVAYYFNVHPENVPFFVYPRKGWAKRLKGYFRRRGLKAIWIKSLTVPKKGTFIVVGDSLKWKTFTHCVVYRNGKLVFDPDYPSRWKDNRITHYLRIARREGLKCAQ